MDDTLVDWDDPSDPNGNSAHVAEHGLTRDEVESVLRDRGAGYGVSDSTGRPTAFGTTNTGRYIMVVYETLNPVDPMIVHPVTAYEVPEPA
jgi:hypothetical protein